MPYSPRVTKDPIRSVLARGMENAQQARPVYTARQKEYEVAADQLLAEVWAGRQPPSRGYLEHVAHQLQTILDKPL